MDVFYKLLKVAAHLAVATQLADLLAALAHNPAYAHYWWAFNIAQVLIIELVQWYQQQPKTGMIDSLPDDNESGRT